MHCFPVSASKQWFLPFSASRKSIMLFWLPTCIAVGAKQHGYPLLSLMAMKTLDWVHTQVTLAKHVTNCAKNNQEKPSDAITAIFNEFSQKLKLKGMQ